MNIKVILAKALTALVTFIAATSGSIEILQYVLEDGNKEIIIALSTMIGLIAGFVKYAVSNIICNYSVTNDPNK